MKATLLQDQPGERTFALIFGAGEEALTGLREFAREANLTAAHFAAAGAFRDLVFGYFDPDRKAYLSVSLDEQTEVLSLIGKVAHQQGEPRVHVHAVVGKQDGSAHDGHLLEAHVWPTLEVMVVETPAYLRRAAEETAGLALHRPGCHSGARGGGTSSPAGPRDDTTPGRWPDGKVGRE